MSLQKNFSKLLALSAIACAGASSQGQVTSSPAGYLLRVHYVKGQVLNYNTRNTILGAQSGGKSAAPMSVTMPIVIHVTDVVKGAATVSVKVGPIKMGNSVVNPGQTVTLTLDSRNQASSDTMARALGAQFPVKPVRIGSSWTTVAPIPDMTGAASQKMRAVYKFAGLKTVNGKSVAVITYNLTGGARGSGTLRLLTSDGTLYTNDAKVAMPTAAGQVTVSSTMVRS